MAAIRHRAPRLPAVPWINYLRVPAGLSALLLLVWFPLILRLRTHYQASTTLSPNPFLWHWLAVTGVLFLLSAGAFAVRLRTARRAVAPPPPSPRPAGQPGQPAGDGAPAQQAQVAGPGAAEREHHEQAGSAGLPGKPALSCNTRPASADDKRRTGNSRPGRENRDDEHGSAL